MQADGREAGSVKISVRWRHPYRRIRLLSPQSSSESVSDPKQEETENPLLKPVITVTATPVSIATITRSSPHEPETLAPGCSSPLSKHAASLTFPDLSESGSVEASPVKDSLAELPRQATCKDDTQLASQEQKLVKDAHQKQNTPPSSKHPLDHQQPPQQGKLEAEDSVSDQDESSLTLTEISDGEDEIGEELTEVSEDTVFEETLPTAG